MSKNTRNRILLTAVAALLLVTLSIGGTLAWLQASSDTVTNTFAPSTINIVLKEHDYNPETDALGSDEVITEADYKMVPGDKLPKDPFVTVKSGSEKCWVFIQVTESTNLDTFISYNVDVANNKWVALTGVDNVYYWHEAIDASGGDVTKFILAGNEVTVNNVTKAQMDGLTETTKPTLTFKAYAVQSENLTVSEMTDIWALANPASGN